jgi:deoxyribonuclease-4
MLIGCFVENNEKNKYLEGSFLQAKECNADCFMFYLGAPQTSIRKPIEQLNVEKFKILMEKDNFNFDKVFVHAPYILNLATNEEEIQKFIIDFLIKECKRVSQIGCKYLIVHPGNAVKNMDVNQAILNCANIINSVIEKNNDVCICIETMSGKGSEIGRNFSQISQIIKLVKQKDKIGVCLDTCHI